MRVSNLEDNEIIENLNFIAFREITCRPKRRAGQPRTVETITVTYKISAPYTADGQHSWCCIVVCDSPHFKKTMVCHGADSMQAMHLSIQLGALFAHEATYYCNLTRDSLPVDP